MVTLGTTSAGGISYSTNLTPNPLSFNILVVSPCSSTTITPVSVTSTVTSGSGAAPPVVVNYDPSTTNGITISTESSNPT